MGEPVEGPVASELVSRDMQWVDVGSLPYLSKVERARFKGIEGPLRRSLAGAWILVIPFLLYFLGALIYEAIDAPNTWWGVVALGLGVLVAVLYDSHARGKRRLAYLESIGFFERTHTPIPKPKRPAHAIWSSSGDSRRSTDHEWYGGRSELNWHDRQMGQTLGFTDGGTFVSNWLESDVDRD